MGRVARSAWVGARGVDTVAQITPAMAESLRQRGVDFAVRYLGSLTIAEVDILLDQDIAVMACTYSRKPGWVPTQGMGTTDGFQSVTRARNAGLPDGTTLWLDLEGPAKGTEKGLIEWAETWAQPVTEAGFIAGLYVGYDPQLTGKELYALKKITRYWSSLSREADRFGAIAEPSCGWCMHQLFPSEPPRWQGYDVIFIQSDFKGSTSSTTMGRTPTWCVRE